MNKHVLGYGTIVLALGTVLYLWHKNEVAVAVAAEKVKGYDQVIQQAKDAIAQTEKARADAVAQLEAEKAKPATVQTVTKYLSAPLPEGSEVKIEKLPDAPTPQVVVTGDPQKVLDAIRDMEISHAECDKNLSACSTELKSTQAIAGAAEQQRDTWKQTAKGGSKWHRLAKALKVVGCAGGGAAIGSLWKAKGAAIGGAAGAGVCEVAF